MKPLGLTREQLIERRKGLGGSDAAKIIAGEWYELWLEKTGRAEAKAILSPWDAAVRHTLEPLILDWYEETTGHPITRRGETVVCQAHPILRCNLDGFDAALAKPIDAKALNIWTPEPLKWAIEHYTPQIHHQMICTEAEQGALYVSLGMKEPELVEIAYDEFFAAAYIERCVEFWRYVETNKPPPEGAPALAVPQPVPVYRAVDLDALVANQAKEPLPNWAAWLHPEMTTWRETKPAADKNAAAVKKIKALLPDDVSPCTFAGVELRRDKRGLGIKEKK